jgi:hypothetical protein
MTVYDKIDYILRKEMDEVASFNKRDLLLVIMDLKERLLLELNDNTINDIYKEYKSYEPIL